jgi:dolichol-phosphate mannosyltransferase
MLRVFRVALFLLQAIAAVRAFGRMARTAGGSRIERSSDPAPRHEPVAVLLPVLNEEHRLEPCLRGLVCQGPEVTSILVVDGGSTDGTPDLVRDGAARDARITLVDASPVPDDINGKAHNLETGFRRLPDDAAWVLTIDADVRPKPGLVRSLIAHARETGVNAFSVATRQDLSGAGEGLVHPSMLTTLVYRFGIPGNATTDPNEIQANGQCFLVRRVILDAAGGFSRVQDVVSEDVTLARIIAMNGNAVGFYESDDLVSVEMYAGWRDAWDNWTRSLPMRDCFTRVSSAVRLLEATLVQALPIVIAPLSPLQGSRGPLVLLNTGLFVARFGVLAGTARAYRSRPWTYWLSPLADPFVVARIWMMWARREHTWRGRRLVAGDHA